MLSDPVGSDALKPSLATAEVLTPPEPAQLDRGPVANGEATEPPPAKPTTGTKDDVLRAKKRWDYVNTTDSENRKLHLEDLEFAWKRGAQWNQERREARDRERRPWLEFNQTGQFIKQVSNDIRQNKMAITVRPDDGIATSSVADIYSGLVRKIQTDSGAESIYDSASEQAVTAGAGYWRITNEYEGPNSLLQRLRILPLPNGMGVYLDPDCTEPDKSDAQYGFVCEWVDRDAFEREWGEAAQAVSWESSTQGHDYAGWFDGNKICVADYYELEHRPDKLLLLGDGSTIWASEVKVGFPVAIKHAVERTRTHCVWYKMTAADKPLAKYETPFSYIPIVMCVGDEMNVDGATIRRGLVRNLRDAAMLYNYFFTTAAEVVSGYSKSPWLTLNGQTDGHPEWEDANVEMYSKLTYEPVELPNGQFHVTPPMRNEPSPVPAALVQMCGLCANLFREITGLKDPALGNHTQEQSGVAILARDRISDTATFHYIDNLKRAIRHTGVIIVDAAPRVYDTQRTLVLQKMDGTEDKKVINQGMPDRTGAPMKLNNLRAGAYSVVVDVGPSYATQRLEAANKITEFLNVVDPSQRPLITDLAAKMIDGPDNLGDRMAARLFLSLPPNIQLADAQTSQNPQVQALAAALKDQQQKSMQAMQAVQGQLQQVQKQNEDLSTLLLNKSKELDLSIAKVNSDREDKREKNEISELKIAVDAVLKLVTAQNPMLSTALLPGAVPGVAQAEAALATSHGPQNDIPAPPPMMPPPPMQGPPPGPPGMPPGGPGQPPPMPPQGGPPGAPQ